MRIKRFIAPDIRTALRMVRDEQGAEAVILSNRSTADGIEIVAATDYDEALVQQALRTASSDQAAPSAAPAAAPAPLATATATAHTDIPRADSLDPGLAGMALAEDNVSWSARAAAVAREPALATTAAVAAPAAPARRAVFQIDDRPGQEARFEVADVGPAEPSAVAPVAAAPLAAAADAQPAEAPAPSRFEMMMAALTRHYVAAPAPEPAAPMPTMPTPAAPMPVEPAPVAQAQDGVEKAHPRPSAPALAAPTAPAAPIAFAALLAPDASAAEHAAPAPASEAPPAAAANDDTLPAQLAAAESAPALQAVREPTTPEPAVAAMREELGLMRRMIERELGQLAGERMRGSPARALAMDLLLDYGCTQGLAQAVAERIDPTLDPARVPPVMLAALAQMLPVLRQEPIENGGIIALVGPTGAGKTTTAAKLAARFAARHRARDVALVTTDHHRTGAREQLQGFGRRLGITVCEAAGPESLADTLRQLSDYPLVLVDTAGYAGRDRALGSQLAWLRTTQGLRSLLVLPANGNPLDLADMVRRYRGLRPEGAVLTKVDETGRLGAALSVLLEHELRVAYSSHGQQVPADLEPGDASSLVLRLEKLRRAADNPLVNEDRHAIA